MSKMTIKNNHFINFKKQQNLVLNLLLIMVHQKDFPLKINNIIKNSAYNKTYKTVNNIHKFINKDHQIIIFKLLKI